MLTAIVILIILGGLGLAWSIWAACNYTSSTEGAFGIGLTGIFWLCTTIFFASSLIQKI